MRKKTKAPDLSWIKFGLVAAAQTAEDEAKGQMSILHFCGYPKKPTMADVNLLKEELNTDPEFGLVGRMGVDVFIMEATPDMVKFYTDMGKRATPRKKKKK